MSQNAASVAILGFSTYERSTFDAFFRLAARRTPAYTLVTDADAADLLIVDADDLHGTERVKRRGVLDRCLMLGEAEHPGAAQHLRRPINLMLVVRALDALPVAPAAPAPLAAMPLLVRPLAAAGAFAAAPAVTGAITGAITRAITRAHPPAEPVRVQAPPPVAAPRIEPPLAAGPSDDRRLDHILVVDDSDIALRFMAANLARFGFQVHLARSGEEALERLSRQSFEMVFLDVTMEGMDGFKTCKAIKRARYTEGRQPPAVVMLTGRGTPVDKMRGTMAGCDAYLTKPLREGELLAVVGEREVKRHAYATTFVASATLI
jgi:two-component system, cell cycle response regulator